MQMLWAHEVLGLENWKIIFVIFCLANTNTHTTKSKIWAWSLSIACTRLWCMPIGVCVDTRNILHVACIPFPLAGLRYNCVHAMNKLKIQNFGLWVLIFFGQSLWTVITNKHDSKIHTSNQIHMGSKPYKKFIINICNNNYQYRPQYKI